MPPPRRWPTASLWSSSTAMATWCALTWTAARGGGEISKRTSARSLSSGPLAAVPTLYDGKLYLPVLQRDVAVREYGLKDRENQSYLLAVDPQSGKTLWRQVRSSPAVAESRESFATAIPFEYKGQKQLLVAGGDVLSSHDPANGRELWRGGDYNSARVPHWRLVPSPVAGDGIVLVCAPKREPLYAVEADGGAERARARTPTPGSAAT